MRNPTILLPSLFLLASAHVPAVNPGARPDLAAANPIPREASPFAGITALAPRQDPTAAPTTTTGPEKSPSPCFTETTAAITSCTTNERNKLICFQTTVPSSVCRAGVICQVDGQGNPSCMFEQSKLDLAGIIIAIFFATAIVASVVGICFFCCRERKAQRRLIRAAEAAKIAQEAKTQALVDAKKANARGIDSGADRQPLMSQPGGSGQDLPQLPPLQQQQQQQQYGGAYGQESGTGYGGANPFADSHDGHPLR